MTSIPDGAGETDESQPPRLASEQAPASTPDSGAAPESPPAPLSGARLSLAQRLALGDVVRTLEHEVRILEVLIAGTTHDPDLLDHVRHSLEFEAQLLRRRFPLA